MNAPVVSLTLGQLFTWVPIAEPNHPDRRWKLLAYSTVMPIAMSGAKQRYFQMVNQLTDKEWHFAEGAAHLLRREMFEQLQYPHFGNELPIFVTFPDVLVWDEQQVVGFVTHSTRLVQTSGDPGVTIMGIPTQAEDAKALKARALPATAFNKPVAKRYRFPSKSSKGLYEVVIYTDKTVSCNCPGWTRHAARDCKHVKDISVIEYIRMMK